MEAGGGTAGGGERAEGRPLYIASFLLWTITSALLRLYENYLRYNFNKRNAKTSYLIRHAVSECMYLFARGMRRFTRDDTLLCTSYPMNIRLHGHQIFYPTNFTRIY